jgi:hypothetical protein
MTDSHCSLQEIPIFSYLPDSYKVRSGPGVSGKGDVRYSYETTPKWHGFLMIRLAASMAFIKQRTAEYRISNRRISKDGFAALNLFIK